MNKLDKSLYKALKFLANNTRIEIKSMQERGFNDYDKVIPSTPENPTEQTLIRMGYLDKGEGNKWMITQTGLQQLRDLEKIRHRDLIIWLSSTSLSLSIFTLAIVQKWITI